MFKFLPYLLCFANIGTIQLYVCCNMACSHGTQKHLLHFIPMGHHTKPFFYQLSVLASFKLKGKLVKKVFFTDLEKNPIFNFRGPSVLFCYELVEDRYLTLNPDCPIFGFFLNIAR